MPSASAFSRSWAVISASVSVFGASVFAGGVLAEDPLQGAPMHVETARRLRDVAVALLEDALDVLPAHAVGRHRILRRRRHVMAARAQSRLDGVGIGRLRQI